MSLLDRVEFDTLYSFVYSPRPGTAALDLSGPVSERVGRERLERLQAHQRSIQERRHRAWVGRTVEVLVEGPSKRDPEEWTGRTPEYRIVNFRGNSRPGNLETLRIVRSSAFSLRGEARGARS